MSVEVLLSSSGFNHIVITPSLSKTTYIVTVNSFTGRPFFTGVPMVDMFPDHKFAIQQITEKYKPTTRRSGLGIIGMAKDANSIVLGLIDDFEVTGYLPGGHIAKTVKHITYITLPYTAETSFEGFQLANNHFFCDDFDLTRLFPSSEKVECSDTDFIYNKNWIKPFADIGLEHCCVSLIQGVFLTSSLPGRDFSITYILRRSSLNPGTRYLARGLNNENEPGNEVECEIIFAKENQFWTQSWRRGSAPIRWKTVLASSLSKPVHAVSEDFSNGTDKYFQKLSKRFSTKNKNKQNENETESIQEDLPLIRCISLLETGEHKSEHDVYEAFEKAVKELPEKGINNVSFVPFDLNSILHQYGAKEAKLKLQELVKPYLDNDGFTYGTFPNTINHLQQGLLRFNCADSLDRVNLATFFYALVVTEKWLDLQAQQNPQNSKLYKFSQDIIDFLAKAFVTSGHVVSLLYTNTPAIKTSHIRAFSPNINVEFSDSTTTIKRRIQNVAFDPNRNKIIYDFVYPGIITKKIVIDPEHIFMYPCNFPTALFEVPTSDFFIDSPVDVMIALPRPMIVCKFSIRHCYAKDVLILGGQSPNNLNCLGTLNIPRTRKWCRYTLHDVDSYGFDNFNRIVSNFLVIRFISQTPRFICGNIRIECEIPTEGQLYNTWRPLADEPSLVRFTSYFEEFLKGNRKLLDALILEKMRLGLNIAEDVRNILCVKHGINPYLCDSATLIRNAKKIGCAFCGDLEAEQKSFYVRSTQFKGLVVDYEQGDDYLGCCSQCYETIDQISLLAKLYATEYFRPLHIPKFEILKALPQKIDRINEISFPSSTKFDETEENELLLSQGGEFKIEGEKSFNAYFVKNSIISTIIFEASTSEFLLKYQNCELKPTTIEELNHENENSDENNEKKRFKVVFAFKEQPITQLLNFVVVGDVTLYKFRCFGVFINNEEKTFKKVKRVKVIPDVNSYGYEWRESERTAIYKFDGKKRISEIGINVNRSDVYIIAQSLLFVFICDKTIVGTQHLVLPRIKEGSDLWYSVETEPFTRIEVYYIDRLCTVRPHTIGFTFISTEPVVPPTASP